MTDISLALPIVTCVLAALVALACGLTGLNRRVPVTVLAWLLAAAPAASFALLFLSIGPMMEHRELSASVAWLPSLGLSSTLYFDGLTALFALLITGIGALIVVYAGYYFKGDQSAWRFLCYLMLFMASMIGLVMAGDVITLFVFWELTSITSYLLIGYKYKDADARNAAFKALVITGGGGIALLAGLLFLSAAAGGGDFQTILANGEAVRNSATFGIMLGLIAFGAFTKSAQVPAHIWLPGAMVAPTPASAYLHSATMVKAGIYLMARLNPVFGPTEAWFWLLSLFGLATMVVGAYLSLKQNDLKAMLAYSTVAQLGVLMVLVGQNTELASKALVIGILAHALYKSALFMVAGIVDHAAHTRDIRRLGGLAKPMRATFLVTIVGAMSMAGLPPLFGFLAKETLLATSLHPTIPKAIEVIFPAMVEFAGAFLLATALMFIVDTFLGKPRDPTIHAHEAPVSMWLMPAIPVALSVLFAMPVLPEAADEFLARAAGNTFGGPVKITLELFHGIDEPFILSMVAITLGLLVFAERKRVRAFQERLAMDIGDDIWDRVYGKFLAGLDGLAKFANRSQNGKLRTYISVMLACMAVMLLLFGRMPAPPAPPAGQLTLINVIYLASLALVVGASAVTIVIRRDFAAILALGASGLGVALLMTLEPTPDVALVQVVVDIVTTVVLFVALARIPREMRLRANQIRSTAEGWKTVRHAAIAAGVAVVTGLIAYTSLATRPHESIVTPFYEANSKPLTGAYDIVGAIVVDFRGFDTLIEISVFSIAGLGVYSLLQYAAKKHHDVPDEALADPPLPPVAPGAARGIAAYPTSVLTQMLGKFMIPFALLIAFVHMIYGHEQPGDGFTAGVIISLSIGLSYVVFGYAETKKRVWWAHPSALIPAGILLVIGAQAAGVLVNGAFFSPVDFGQLWSLPLPDGFYFSSSFLFEVGICLTVIGSVSFTLDGLGRPMDSTPADLKIHTDIEHMKELGAVTTDEAAPAQPSHGGHP